MVPVNWRVMTEAEQHILPDHVSWREFIDHCLDHDPLPEGTEHGAHPVEHAQG